MKTGGRTGLVGWRGSGHGVWLRAAWCGRLLGGLGVLGWALLVAGGCGGRDGEVVVYAAQDRVFAEPLMREYERANGVRVRVLYDNEATKTVGLANRLLAESGRPRADLWWSNEEMRTRQLVARGVLEPGWKAVGNRRRVLVVRTGTEAGVGLGGGQGARLAVLTNAAWRGRVALAYPVFGSTSTHFLALRERWGEEAWRAWCMGLAGNRPLVVDGNSVVVRMVGSGQADVGLTDSDDVAFGRREGLAVEEVPLAAGDGLVIPNSVALVRGSGRRLAAEGLAAYLAGAEALGRLREAGALELGGEGVEGADGLGEAEWARLLGGMDGSLEELKRIFLR